MCLEDLWARPQIMPTISGTIFNIMRDIWALNTHWKMGKDIVWIGKHSVLTACFTSWEVACFTSAKSVYLVPAYAICIASIFNQSHKQICNCNLHIVFLVWGHTLEATSAKLFDQLALKATSYLSCLIMTVVEAMKVKTLTDSLSSADTWCRTLKSHISLVILSGDYQPWTYIDSVVLMGFSGVCCSSGMNPQPCCFKSKKKPKKDGSVFYQKMRGLIVWKKHFLLKEMKVVFFCQVIESVFHAWKNLNHDMFLAMVVKEGIVGRRHKTLLIL